MFCCIRPSCVVADIDAVVVMTIDGRHRDRHNDCPLVFVVRNEHDLYGCQTHCYRLY